MKLVMRVESEAEALFYVDTLDGADLWCKPGLQLEARDGHCFSVEVLNHEGGSGWSVVVREVVRP